MIIDDFKNTSKISEETIKSIVAKSDLEIIDKFVSIIEVIDSKRFQESLVYNAFQCKHFVTGFIAAVEILDCIQQQKEIDALEDLIK